MKLFTSMIAIVVLAASACAQQAKPPAPSGRIGTATRLVVIFRDLERKLMTARQNQDTAALDQLLAPSFETWTPEPPGEPIPRAQWLEKSGTPGESFSLRQMAVRDLGGYAIASFVLLETVAGRTRAQFVVDLWSSTEGMWKLTDRYTAPVAATAYAGERKPTGKD